MAAGVLLSLQFGREIGMRQRSASPDAESLDIGVANGTRFGLLSLLVAFTFSSAVGRFEARRQLIAPETNAIATPYLRIDLLPTSAQPQLREDFRNYVDARIAAYRKFPDIDAVSVETRSAVVIQSAIWKKEVAASCEAPSPSTQTLVLSALNSIHVT